MEAYCVFISKLQATLISTMLILLQSNMPVLMLSSGFCHRQYIPVERHWKLRFSLYILSMVLFIMACDTKGETFVISQPPSPPAPSAAAPHRPHPTSRLLPSLLQYQLKGPTPYQEVQGYCVCQYSCYTCPPLIYQCTTSAHARTCPNEGESDHCLQPVARIQSHNWHCHWVLHSCSREPGNWATLVG